MGLLLLMLLSSSLLQSMNQDQERWIFSRLWNRAPNWELLSSAPGVIGSRLYQWAPSWKQIGTYGPTAAGAAYLATRPTDDAPKAAMAQMGKVAGTITLAQFLQRYMQDPSARSSRWNYLWPALGMTAIGGLGTWAGYEGGDKPLGAGLVIFPIAALAARAEGSGYLSQANKIIENMAKGIGVESSENVKWAIEMLLASRPADPIFKYILENNLAVLKQDSTLQKAQDAAKEIYAIKLVNEIKNFTPDINKLEDNALVARLNELVSKLNELALLNLGKYFKNKKIESYKDTIVKIVKQRFANKNKASLIKKVKEVEGVFIDYFINNKLLNDLETEIAKGEGVNRDNLIGPVNMIVAALKRKDEAEQTIKILNELIEKAPNAASFEAVRGILGKKNKELGKEEEKEEED